MQKVVRQSCSSKQEVCNCVGGNCKGQGSSCIQGSQGQVAVGAACCLINRSVPVILGVFCRARKSLKDNCVSLAKQKRGSMATTKRRVGVCACCMGKVSSVARDHQTYQPAGKGLCIIGNRGSRVPDSMGKGYLSAVSWQLALCDRQHRQSYAWQLQVACIAPLMHSADFGMQSLLVQCTMHAPYISGTMPCKLFGFESLT